MSYVTQGRHGPWYSSRPMPSLWFCLCLPKEAGAGTNGTGGKIALCITPPSCNGVFARRTQMLLPATQAAFLLIRIKELSASFLSLSLGQ
jgi:hypothetical protein